MVYRVGRVVLIGAMIFPLAACLQDAGGASFVSRLKSQTATLGATEAEPTKAGFAATATDYDNTLNAESHVISGLVARQSLLPANSAYDQVTGAVLAANSRAAESKLRAARLRAESASKNWLPTLGPSVSLTSLSDVIVNLVVEQVVFDNGRKKGERAFAKADVEVAAVALSEDTNDRAATALGLYVTAQEGREKARLAQVALKDMQHFEYIMSERVRGGVSDMADLNITRQKLAEIRASLRLNQEATRSAIAELNAMAIHPLDEVRGMTPLEVSAAAAQPLSVTKAEAEKTRAIAAASVERAGLLPGISLKGTLGANGGVGLNAGGAQLGLGTRAQMRAVAMATETAGRQVAQATEDANRTLRKLESQIEAKSRQVGEAHSITVQAKTNLDLFQAQYKAGQRQVMDVVGVYETFARAQEAEATLKFEAARLRIEMARILGVLADGALI